MIRRRKLIKAGLYGAIAAGTGLLKACTSSTQVHSNPGKLPLTMSTWGPNVKANALAHSLLLEGHNILDALEKGINVPESDPDDTSVGYGGWPDRDGNVTLDACIMDAQGNAGSVICLKNIMHPISVARKVKDESPHLYLAADGALAFALEQGFKEENLLSQPAKEAWEQWVEDGRYDPMATPKEILNRIKNNHDTIGMLAIDLEGHISGGCSTSGLGFKYPGRVGDSPIIGAGLFVDDEVGAATATGVGEEIAKICGAHAIVECMRHGYSPQEACKEAISRIVKKYPRSASDLQVGFIACNKAGEYGAFAINPDFTYCVNIGEDETRVIESPSIFS